jgi:glycosyltransferase involved in cell wall biosynthesis
MKAVVVTPYYYPKGGGLENYARQLNKALTSLHGWEIVIITSDNKRQKLSTVDQHRIYRLGTWFKLSNTPFNPLWPFQIRCILNNEKPDLIIAHAPVPSLADAAAIAKGSTPFVTVYHAATLLRQGSPLFNVFARAYRILGNQSLKRANNIWAVSEFVREQLPASLTHKALVLPNAVWTSEIKKRSQIDSPKFVFIASLDKSHSWKGLSEVLEAIALCRNKYGVKIKLSVIGDGSAKARYITEAEALGISKYVKFTGRLEGQAKIRELRKAKSLIVYPNTSNDAFPTVVLEAWSQHVPVVAAEIGPLPSIINNLVDGFLCAPTDPEALAEELASISLAPLKTLNKVANTAAVRTKQSFTWEKQAQTVEAFVRAIL